jgi:hypothetical protein
VFPFFSEIFSVCRGLRNIYGFYLVKKAKVGPGVAKIFKNFNRKSPREIGIDYQVPNLVNDWVFFEFVFHCAPAPLLIHCIRNALSNRQILSDSEEQNVGHRLGPNHLNDDALGWHAHKRLLWGNFPATRQFCHAISQHRCLQKPDHFSIYLSRKTRLPVFIRWVLVPTMESFNGAIELLQEIYIFMFYSSISFLAVFVV